MPTWPGILNVTQVKVENQSTSSTITCQDIDRIFSCNYQISPLSAASILTELSLGLAPTWIKLA